jgi:hypothetical protein
MMRRVVLTRSVACGILIAGLAFVCPSDIHAQDSTARPAITGSWVARNFRPASGIAALTFVMQLEESRGEVRGQIRWEQAGGFGAAGEPTVLRGTLTQDSLSLRDTRGTPILEGRVEGGRYTARIAITVSRLGGPISLLKLGPDAKAIRFDKQ